MFVAFFLAFYYSYSCTSLTLYYPRHQRFANCAIGPSGLIRSFKFAYGTLTNCGPAAYGPTWYASK